MLSFSVGSLYYFPPIFLSPSHSLFLPFFLYLMLTYVSFQTFFPSFLTLFSLLPFVSFYISILFHAFFLSLFLSSSTLSFLLYFYLLPHFLSFFFTLTFSSVHFLLLLLFLSFVFLSRMFKKYVIYQHVLPRFNDCQNSSIFKTHAVKTRNH